MKNNCEWLRSRWIVTLTDRVQELKKIREYMIKDKSIYSNQDIRQIESIILINADIYESIMG